MNTMLPHLDESFTEHHPGGAGPRDAEQPLVGSALNLSRRSYWILTALTIAAFLAIWLSHFPLLYGWHLDDWACYVKGRDTIADPKAAFTVRCNALHAYFFLYSYLPLWSGISLPSHELPIYGELTGNFRFFILWTILFHALVAASWAWFAPRVCGNRLAAWFSVVLLVTSQQFTLWTPQPETRYVGLPLALVGLYLLLGWADGPWTSPGGRREAVAFAAGTLFFVSQWLHYTSLYLIVPLSLSLCAGQFVRGGWRYRGFWTAWSAFAVGCLWMQAGVEFFSRFILHIPFGHGPLKALLALNQEHASPFTIPEQLHIWSDYLVRLAGLPLIVTACVGAWLYARRAGDESSEPLSRQVRLRLVNGMVFAMLLLTVIPTTPIFRKTSNLQPLWFLFASVAIVELASRLTGRRWIQAAVAAAGLAAVGALPLARSIDLFQGHLGLGRAIVWAEHHRGQRPLRWLITHAAYAYLPEETLDDDPDTLVLCYFPLESLATRPVWRYYLNACEPIHREKTIWSIFSDHIRHPYWTNVDLSRESDICEARVYRAGDLARAIRPGRPLRVESVWASSAAEPMLEAANVFEGGRAPDRGTGWVPASRSMPQTLEVAFDRAYPLDRLVVLQSMSPQRIAALDLLAAGDDGRYEALARPRDLAPSQVVALAWPRRPVRRLKLVIHGQQPALVNGQGRRFQPEATLRIEELLFPGYTVEPLPLARALPPLELATIRRDGGVLIANGKNISKATRMVLAGRELPTDRSHIPPRIPFTLDTFGVWPSDELRALEPAGEPLGPDRREVYLTDGLRRSNSLWIERGAAPATASRDDAPAPALASEWALPGEETAADTEEDRSRVDRPNGSSLAGDPMPNASPAPRSADIRGADSRHPTAL